MVGKHQEALNYLELHHYEKEHVINAQTHKIIEAYRQISDRQKMEAVAKAQEERVQIIEQKNRELDAFFYKISHDLKGPITSIIGMDGLIRDEISDGKALEYFDIYKKQMFRINNILDELMRITRIDHYSERKEQINFREMALDCISSFSYLKLYKRVNFTIDVDEDVEYHAEWSIINSILQNLIENAIKYADEKKEHLVASISVRKEGESLIMIAKDNGIGMPEEVRVNVFEMFYRGGHQCEGSGLGLYILNRAVEKLQGTAELESKPGEGTKFIISLPFS